MTKTQLFLEILRSQNMRTKQAFKTFHTMLSRKWEMTVSHNLNPEVFGAEDSFWNVILLLHPFLKVNFAADYDHFARVFQPFATKHEISKLKG